MQDLPVQGRGLSHRVIDKLMLASSSLVHWTFGSIREAGAHHPCMVFLDVLLSVWHKSDRSSCDL